MSARLVFALALLVLAPLARGATPPGTDDVQDVVFFHDAQPVFLRFHIEIDGKPYQTHWAETIAKLHRYLDADGDGKLSARERAAWLPQLGGGNRNGQGQNQGQSQGRSADSVVTVADLADFLRPSFGAFQLQVVNRNDPAVETLFDLLDLDGDKTLSTSELTAAESTLMKLDQDEDETIRAREVLPYQNPLVARRQNRNLQNQAAATTPPPFLAIGPREPRAALARRLLTQYDKHGGPDDGPGGDHKLQANEIGLDPDAFNAADQDGDGALDSDELVHALVSPPPGLEFQVKIIRNVPALFSTLKVVDRVGKPSPLASALRKGTGNDLLIALESDLVEINLPRQGGVNLRQFYQQQFQAADDDNNKYLDIKESQRNGVFNNIFKFMDRDDDGKVFENEMNEFISRQVDAAESRTLVSVSDQGRSLFQVLDLNRDGSLSIRELRAAVKKVALWDRDQSGTISLEEIPRHHRLEFGTGSSPLLINIGRQDNAENMMVGRPGAVTGQGPPWFRRMDLNLDGDVSAREFLGTRDQFGKLDADHDGLIDATEASKGR